ncbi:MAG: arginine--tRNA ligase [Candidatus Microgenomates bacterium]|jgi:arginyl-tRNA synthetase
MVKDQIIKALQEITGEKEINLEFPENESFGDYSSNIALVLAQKEKKNPREVAESLVEKLNKENNLKSITEKIEVAGPGFINFWLKRDVLINNLTQIDSEKEKYGTSSFGKGKTVVIDYSSPNIAKPFGIGHLRSTIIGQALYNLYKDLGYEIVGDNHLGDWGTQFGKLLYMIKLEKVTDFNITKLEELYVEFHKLAETDPSLEEKAREWFKKLEEGDAEARSIWRKCVEVSIKEFNKIYELLGVKIDFAFGESYYESEMRQLAGDPAVKKYLEKGEDGAVIIDLSKAGIKIPLMFLKNDGATTYATRDLATIKFRMRKWDPSIIIYEVGAEQSLYFQQIFAVSRLLGLVKDSVELIHTAHGLYLAPDGRKFSTRKGKTIKLEEVLDEAIERAKKLGNSSELVAKDVGIGAIKYFDLMHSVGSNVVFDWDKIMNMEGNSGPYLQYTVARTNSVLAKAKGKGREIKVTKNINEEEFLILRSLTRFSEVIETAAKTYSPNILCNYLYELASKYNGFYNKDKIIGGENEDFRLALTQATGIVLKNGLKILGIETPERM